MSWPKIKEDGYSFREYAGGLSFFSAWLEDDELNKSLVTDFTGTIYGTQYQSYLLSFHCF